DARVLVVTHWIELDKDDNASTIRQKILQTLGNPSVQAMITIQDALMGYYGWTIVQAVAECRKPAVYGDTSFVSFINGLMAYGYDANTVTDQIADYIDQILRGADPAVMPMQEPAKWDFACNVTRAPVGSGFICPPWP